MSLHIKGYADNTAFLHKKNAGMLYFSNMTSVSFSLLLLVFHYNVSKLPMSCNARKPIIWVPDKVRHKLSCTATEDGYRVAISDEGSRGIVFSM